MTTRRKRVAIIQSSYIPWKGYFDIIRAVDEFILLDDVQFTRRDWRNRNIVKTASGPIWLTIPVVTKGLYEQSIEDTMIAAPWTERHWATLRANYAKAAHFADIAPEILSLYEAADNESQLSRVNRLFLEGICAILRIPTRFSWSRDHAPAVGRNDRLLSLCQATGASDYLSGPSAAVYLDVEKFRAAGIAVHFADYSGYPEYPQFHGSFTHGVSILDLLFHVGRAPFHCMKPLLS